MPLSKYFGGHGEEVMAEMIEKYGEEEGKRRFYATVNAQKKKGKAKSSSKAKSKRRRRGNQWSRLVED